MEKYLYKAINEKSGKIARGEMTVNGYYEIEATLKEMGMLLINYKRLDKKSLFNLTSSSAKLNNKDLITLFTHLEQLDNAGVSIIESLDDIKNAKSYSQSIKILVQEIYDSLKNGSQFSEALAKHPKIFNKVYIGLIANGEQTGNLSVAFRSIVDNLKWSDSIKKKTIKAIRYPLFSLFIMMVVMMVMTNIVVPKVTAFLTEQKLELPAITIALIGFSNFMQNNGLTIIILIPVSIVIYKFLRRNKEFALVSDKLKLKIPIFGAIIIKLDASRFCNFFSITFESGIGVLECIESTRQVIGNLAIKDSIDIIKQKVSEGHSLAESIEASSYFPGLVVRMFKVGEASGNMKKSLDNIKFFYDQEITDSIDKIVGGIQPALVIVMGGMMLWITAAIFGPIYDSFSKL